MSVALRGILVGVGPRGERWVEALQRNRDVDVVAFVDNNSKTLAAVKERFDLPADRLFTDLSEAIRVTECDFLIDSTPPHMHLDVTGMAFDSGLHVLSEKPISDDFAAAKKLVHSARSAGKTYMISQNYRFHPLPQAMRRYIREGRIGTVEAAVVSFYAGMNFGTHNFRTLMNHPLINDMSIHHFDLMRCCLDADPTSVYAVGYNPSWSWFRGDAATMMIIEFGDIVVNYHASWANVGQGTSEWRIDGSQGSIVTRDGLKHVKGSVWTDGIGRTEERVERLAIDDMPVKDLDYVLVEFVAALRDGREPECSGLDNLRSLVLVFAAIASIDRGEKVSIDEFL